MSGDAPTFPLLPADRTPDELEQEVQARWTAEGLFDRIEAARAGAREWVFYEGPPTANGRPGIHHVFSRTLKDLFCRYHVMRGFHVTRKAGWDTHGLPVEIEVEKRLGISGKADIERIGVAEFNRLSRESVWTYKDEWERLSARIGYDLDYRDPYVTYTKDYVESVWWALKTLYDRNLLYKGHKILPYCVRCGTSLSSHEVAQGYEDVKDPSVYVALTIRDWGLGIGDSATQSPLPNPQSRILVWTTTPWTLVSNTALTVHPDLPYLELRRRDGEDRGTVIVAEARAGGVLGDDFTDRWDIVRRLTGQALAGTRYEHPLAWVAFPDGSEHGVIVAETFVSAEDGTGVVHLSPAFGADDYAAGRRHGLAFVQPVDARGRFPAEMPLIGGQFVKDADPLIVEELKRRGVLWKAGTIEHAYPHCWRCGTPLLYYARESWFIRTTEFRDRMLARNARVRWQPPEVGEGRFGEWLSNNIDWALSRDRYWGTPLPVWVCERDPAHRVAIGSYAELAERLGEPLGEDFDPHKPGVDEVRFPCPSCAASGDGGLGIGEGAEPQIPNPPSPIPLMSRVPEVIDTWFDSGSMPFAQWHYPFENRDVVERLYPADFICEGVDQTRGWFYSMLAIATGLGDALPHNGNARGADAFAAPYRSVVVNDLILDADGVKMSKRLGNIVNPWEVIARHGADAVRLFLVASSQVWVPRRFDEEAIREMSGRFLLTLKNTYSGMFAQYANFGWEPSGQDPLRPARPAIDRWILSRLATVAQHVDRLLGDLEPTLAVRAIMDFVVDDVSNWYVRLSRARFYETDGDDNRAAFATLHEVLVCVSRLLAPFAPFITDWLHRALMGDSVHLAPYATGGCTEGADPSLEATMAHVRVLSRLGRAAREDADIKVRQPLARLVCVVPGGDPERLAELAPLLATELNVKAVEWVSSGADFVRLEARPNFRALGKRFGKRTPLAAQAVAALTDEALRAFERGEDVALSVEGESFLLLPEEATIVRRASGALTVKEEQGYFAALDTAVTPELRQEGLARELVSRIQRMRRDAGFAVSDRILVRVSGAPELGAVLQRFGDYISAEVLAVSLQPGEPDVTTNDAVQATDLDGFPVRIALSRVH
ncbi:MAG TPA: isoleucine--tRNA ligase [Gemmatimonadaceae bacterium]|nr:isoleucine--tRNA ligase [Gemmatimonadaceae bacterium]